MKKLFVLFALLAFSAGVSFAADTYTGSMVEKYTSGITKKEQQLRDNAAAHQKAQQAKQAEVQKKVDAKRAENLAKQKEMQKKVDAQRAENAKRQAEQQKKIQAKKDAFNTLIGK